MKKFILIIAAVFVLLIAGSVIYVLTNIDSIVKAAIEKYGSQATKTEVSVSSVSVRLSSGAASISGLAVSNPPGFSTPDIFSLKDISTRIAVKSVTKTPIVIEDIRISGPEVFYEMNSSGANNLDALKKNMASPEPPKKEPGRKKGQKKEKEVRLFIRKLVFENGRVEVRVASLGNKPVIVVLPRIELNDIGRNGGATPTQVAQTVLTALAEETARTVARTQGQKYLRKGAEEMLKRYLEK